MVEFVITTRSSVTLATGIGPNIAPVNVACALVDVHPPGVAAAHDVDLWLSRDRSSCGKEVAFRDRVFAIGLRANTQDLAAQVVGVSRRVLGIVNMLALAFIKRGVATGISAGMGVVAR